MSTDGKNPADLTDAELEALESAETGAEAETVPETTKEDEDQKADNPAAAASESEQKPEAVSGEQGEQDQKAEGTDKTPKVDGVASKNGKHVLPYHVLQQERRRAEREAARATAAEEKAQALAAQLEDLKAGKKPESTELTEEEVIQMEQDFPEHGKKLRATFELAQKAKAAPSQGAKQAEAEPSDNPIQEAIDQVPMLVEWQFSDPEKFQRATILDEALKTSPKWKGKSLTERFEHVVKLVADEYDIPLEEPEKAAPQKTTTTAADPAKVIANATRAKPNTLSDIKGGTTPETPSTNFERMSPTAQVNRWASMSDEEIDAALAKSGG